MLLSGRPDRRFVHSWIIIDRPLGGQLGIVPLCVSGHVFWWRVATDYSCTVHFVSLLPLPARYRSIVRYREFLLRNPGGQFVHSWIIIDRPLGGQLGIVPLCVSGHVFWWRVATDYSCTVHFVSLLPLPARYRSACIRRGRRHRRPVRRICLFATVCRWFLPKFSFPLWKNFSNFSQLNIYLIKSHFFS